MGLESATFIDGLVTTNPVGSTDQKSQGDDHLRLIKSVLRNSFPNADRAFYFESVSSKSGPYTVVAADNRSLIKVDASGGAVTITLIAVANVSAGFRVAIIKNDNQATDVTVDGTLTETINGAETLVLDAQYEGIEVIFDGVEWKALPFGVVPKDLITSELEDFAGLTPSNSNFIVGDGTNWVAESGATARASMGVAIGSNVQAWDQALDDIAALAVTDGNIIVGDGTNWVAESGATARASLGLVIGTDVQADLDVVPQAEAEAGTATTERIWTAQRVKQAIDALGASAKGWVKFNAAGTVLDSFNVTGVTKNGTGDYTVTWATNFANTNYSAQITPLHSGPAAHVPTNPTFAVGSLRFETVRADTDAGDNQDPETTSVAAFGDQ